MKTAEFASNIALRTIGSAYLIGQRVRHVTQDEDESAGIVVSVIVSDCGLRYLVSFAPGDEVTCLECELVDADEDNARTNVS